SVGEGEARNTRYRGHGAEAHRLGEREVVGDTEQRAADITGVLQPYPLGRLGPPHLLQRVVPQRGRVVPQIARAVLVPVERVDLGRPPVLRRVLHEPAGDADADGHDDALGDDEDLHRVRAQVTDTAAGGESADRGDERYRTVRPAAVHEAGTPALPVRVPLGHAVDAARVHHAGADSAERGVAEVCLPDIGGYGEDAVSDDA